MNEITKIEAEEQLHCFISLCHLFILLGRQSAPSDLVMLLASTTISFVDGCEQQITSHWALAVNNEFILAVRTPKTMSFRLVFYVTYSHQIVKQYLGRNLLYQLARG